MAEDKPENKPLEIKPPENKSVRIGVVDTTFSRVNMGAIALDEFSKLKTENRILELVRRTVPGIKDLAVECKKLLDDGCNTVLALGMVGGAPIDTQCAHEASIGIQQAKLLTNKHIIEVFVHENESWSEREFLEICENRIRKHAANAVLLVENPNALVENAGKGVRQGKEDEGTIGDTADQPIILGIVVASFNEDIAVEMAKTAKETAEESGATILEVIEVPGAFDVPLAVKKLLLNKKIDAVATLGAIIKGETAHDELIAKSTANNLSELSLEYNKPVTLGIIGPDADEDAADERKEEYAERAVNAAISLAKKLRR